MKPMVVRFVLPTVAGEGKVLIDGVVTSHSVEIHLRWGAPPQLTIDGEQVTEPWECEVESRDGKVQVIAAHDDAAPEHFVEPPR